MRYKQLKTELQKLQAKYDAMYMMVEALYDYYQYNDCGDKELLAEDKEVLSKLVNTVESLILSLTDIQQNKLTNFNLMTVKRLLKEYDVK